MKSISLLAVCAFVAGCHGTTAPIVVKEAIKVEVPVPVACIQEVPEEPKWLLDDPAMKQADLFTKGNAALKEIEQRRAHIKELRATLLNCTQLPH